MFFNAPRKPSMDFFLLLLEHHLFITIEMYPTMMTSCSRTPEMWKASLFTVWEIKKSFVIFQWPKQKSLKDQCVISAQDGCSEKRSLVLSIIFTEDRVQEFRWWEEEDGHRNLTNSCLWSPNTVEAVILNHNPLGLIYYHKQAEKNQQLD